MRKWLLLVLLASTCPAQAALAIGDFAPDSLGSDRHGEPVTLHASRGKVVVVTFWASWCTYCRKELPVLEKVQRAAGKAQLQVVGINYKEDAFLFRKMLAGMKDAQMTFTHDRRGVLGREYGLHGLPFLVMIDRDGRIAQIHEGYDDRMLDPIIGELNTLLATPAVAAPAAR